MSEKGKDNTAAKSSSNKNSNPPSRLTSLLPTTGGGLIQPATTASNNDDAGNQDKINKPTGSLLGLDRLAALKRREQKNPAPNSSSSRNYRQRRAEDDETPSVGGVNREALHRAKQQSKSKKKRSWEGNRSRRYRDDSDDDQRSSQSRRKHRSRSRERDDDRRRQRRDHHEDDQIKSRRDESGERRSQDYDDRDRRRREDDRQRDDYSRRSRRDSDERPRRDTYNRSERNYRNDRRYDDRTPRDRRHGNMPAPPPRRLPNVTPSTLSSDASAGRRGQHGSYQQRRRGPDATLDAPTPMRGGLPRNSNPSTRRDRQQATKSGSTSTWDVETPLPAQMDDDPDAALAPLTEANDDDSFDRHFYLQEDEGHYVIEDQGGEDLGRFLFNNNKMEAREKEMEQKRSLRRDPKRNAMLDDQEAWEENRLLSSGAAIKGEVSLDHSTEQDTRVTLLVHQTKPPFLDGRVSFSTQREAVPTVKDASSDFAKMAREGSETLRYLRANKEKHAMRNKFWELGGTRMGDAVGVKNNPSADNKDEMADVNAEGEIDYKKSSGFAEHVKKKKDRDGPVSEFAKKKSIRQQREFLPIFSVREDLLNVVRENTCVVIVGETGKLCRD